MEMNPKTLTNVRAMKESLLTSLLTFSFTHTSLLRQGIVLCTRLHKVKELVLVKAALLRISTLEQDLKTQSSSIWDSRLCIFREAIADSQTSPKNTRIVKLTPVIARAGIRRIGLPRLQYTNLNANNL